MATYNIAIIGGGIAAPLLALSLKSYGLDCIIFESRAQGDFDHGTITLTPNALRILDELGLYDSIRSQGGNFEQIAILDPHWEVLGRLFMGSRRLYGYESIRLPRKILRDQALQAVGRSGIKVCYEHRCETIVEGEQAASNRVPTTTMITFTNGLSVHANFVIGADGFNSIVRQEVFLNSKAPEYTGLYNLSGTLNHAELEVPTLPASIIGPDNFFALMPESTDHSKVSFLASFNVPDLGTKECAALAGNPAERKRILVEQFCRAPWPKWLQNLLSEQLDTTIKGWPYLLLPTLPTWLSSTQNVVLIGDAAHGMPPTGAQGANTAIEDARTLAHAISVFSSNFEHKADVLQKWDTVRRARMEKIVAYTMDNEARLKKQYGPWMQKFREWMMWAVLTYVAPDDGLRWIYGYKWENDNY